MEHPIVKKHLEALGIGKEQMYELSEKELAFQHFVLQEKDGRSRTALGQLRHLIGNRAVPYQEFLPGRTAKRCRYLKTSAQDIHRSILIINMMHMRRTI